MKDKTSISIDSDLLKQAREMGLNISLIANAALQKVIRGYESIELKIMTLQNLEIRLKEQIENLEHEKQGRLKRVKERYEITMIDKEVEKQNQLGKLNLTYDYTIMPVKTQLDQIQEELDALYIQKKNEHKEEEGMRLMRILNERIRQFSYNVNMIWAACIDTLDELRENGITFESKKELQVHIKKLKELQLYG